jgi:hypothetical protein
MTFPTRPSRPLTLEVALKQLDESWEIIESFRSLHQEHQTLKQEHEQLKQDFAELSQRLDEVVSQLKSSSRNSSKPPSSDTPEQKAKRPCQRKRSPRQPGGQPGHPRHERALLPEQDVDQINHYFPHEQCECGGQVAIDQQPHYRHQLWDILPTLMNVTEHQFFKGTCRGCGRTHFSQWPAWLPRGQMGAGLISWIGMLSGQYHLSIQQIQSLLQEMCQATFSTGAISNAQGKLTEWLETPYQQVGDYVRQQDVAHADETRHSHKHSRHAYWMWTLVSGPFCLFLTQFSRGKQAAKTLLGAFSGYLVTDHYAAYNDYPHDKHQLCWAHLLRHFLKISERRGQAGAIGKRLLLIGHAVIRTHHRFAQQPDKVTIYQRRMQRLRRSFQATLQKGKQLNPVIAQRTHTQCDHLLRDEDLCWTFLQHPTIPLTNNRAESALRPYVIWRKLSFATQSLQGLRFRPMILTVTTTARRLGMSSLEVLRAISEQGLARKKITFRFPFDQRIT